MGVMTNVLEVNELRMAYAGGGWRVDALTGVSMTVASGEFVAIMGASGSGKSTLLHLIGGLDKPTYGSVVIDGQDIGRMSDRARTIFRRRNLGIIFQAYNLLPTLTAVENVTLPLVVDGVSRRASVVKATSLLEQVHLGHRLKHRPHAMAGGEQQRVAIARSLMNDPLLVLADEPTGNLDTHHSESIWQLLGALAREQGRTVVAVTHEPGGATHADRIIVIKDGAIVGEIKPGGEGHASDVAARYTELVS